ncbi:MAG: Ribonuclease [Candidatus Parcubacteria bacterium]|jgi:ribonuclease P protein component
MSADIATKAQRLDTQGVARVMSQGRAIQSGSFLLKLLKNSSTEPSKVAYVAPKKLFKTAVVRNKAKRTGRALVTALQRKKPFEKGLSIAFLFRPPIIQRDFADLLEEMEQVLTKNGIITV